MVYGYFCMLYYRPYPALQVNKYFIHIVCMKVSANKHKNNLGMKELLNILKLNKYIATFI